MGRIRLRRKDPRRRARQRQPQGLSPARRCAFSNHRSQGISAFLSSPFLRRPLALLPEDGSKLDPASLHQDLLQLSNWKDCQHYPNACDELKTVDDNIIAARKATLNLDWATATSDLNQAQNQANRLIPAKDIKDVP